MWSGRRDCTHDLGAAAHMDSSGGTVGGVAGLEVSLIAGAVLVAFVVAG